ncbi:hypothetical protein CUTER_08115 [Corynebacterium uterequi]|uniref:Uncharacterized protein n=1 Tax=Corynebacterium uterequi TaxID=1072256 RepID=A0A0G3HIA6_9CORY|nr:hypothetical protein CUTER_08115 [Corynebacterium uterequi]
MRFPGSREYDGVFAEIEQEFEFEEEHLVDPALLLRPSAS